MTLSNFSYQGFDFSAKTSGASLFFLKSQCTHANFFAFLLVELEMILRETVAGIAMCSPHSEGVKLEYTNEGFFDLFGYTRDEYETLPVNSATLIDGILTVAVDAEEINNDFYYILIELLTFQTLLTGIIELVN